MPDDFVDIHVHTDASDCARDMPVPVVLDLAAETGARFIVTDHAFQIFFGPARPWSLFSEEAGAIVDEEGPAAPERFERYLERMTRAFDGVAPVGIELDVLPDERIVIPEGYIARFPFVLGTVHFLLAAHRKQSPGAILEEFRRQTRRMLESGMVHALAHPFRVLAQDDLPVDDDLIEWVVALARRNDVALEINAHKQHDDIDVRTTVACVRAGAQIAIGTDSHEPSEFGDFSYHRTILDAVRERGEDPDPLIYEPDIQRLERLR